MNKDIRIQIYGIRTPSDALMVAEMGAHHIGVSYGRIKRTPGQVGFDQAKAIFDAVRDSVVRVGLTVATEIDEIVEMVTIVRPDVLHLSGDIEPFPPEQVAALRNLVPGLKIMQAIPVVGTEALEYIRQYEHVSDIFLLDTKVEHATDIGATGLTHDWNIDKQIVQSTKVPCILAGGLSSNNVAEAIQVVKPWGVDSFTHTNLEHPSGDSLKDPEKVRAFVQAVKGASG
jgi:phosphoribosylanthranilate isomerase